MQFNFENDKHYWQHYFVCKGLWFGLFQDNYNKTRLGKYKHKHNNLSFEYQIMEERLPSYTTQAKIETSKEDGGAKAIENGGVCLNFMVFGVVKWWLLLQAI